MAAATYIATVQTVYVAYYGRPADPGGLAFWTGQLDRAGGDLTQILQSFGNSDEARTLFGSGSTEAKVNNIFRQLFGRDADPEGLRFYSERVNNGSFSLVDVAQRVADGAKGDDATIIANRVTTARRFTEALDTDAENKGYAGNDAARVAREFVGKYTLSSASQTEVDQAVRDTVAAGQGGTIQISEVTADLISKFVIDPRSSVNFDGVRLPNAPLLTADTTPTFILQAKQSGLDYVIDWGNGVRSTGKTTGGEQFITLPTAYRGVDEHLITLSVSGADGAFDRRAAELSVAESTGSVYLNGLLFGTKIENAPLSNGRIPVFVAFVQDPAATGSNRTGYAFDATTLDAFGRAFAAYESVANIDFIRVEDPRQADLKIFLGDNAFFRNTFGSSNVVGAFGFPDFQKVSRGGVIGAGVGVFNRDAPGWGDFAEGSDAFATIVHELGHALGLAHPHDRGGVSAVFPESIPNLYSPFSRDVPQYSLNGQDNDKPLATVMSYDYGVDGDVGFNPREGNASTPGTLDIAALERLYGRLDANAGDNVYELSDGASAQDRANLAAIHDTGGNDTLVYNGGNQVVLSLASADLIDRSETLAGFASFVIRSDGTYGDALVFSHRSLIENVVGGSGIDIVVGNAASNRITTGAGEDIVFASAGRDTVDGGADFDSLSFILAGAGVRLDLASGVASSSEGATSFRGFEAFVGSELSDTVIGGSGDDILFWTTGEDRFDAGAGIDLLLGNFSEKPLAFAHLQGFAALYGIENSRDVTQLSGVESVTLTPFDDVALLDAGGMARFSPSVGGIDQLDGSSGFDQLAPLLANNAEVNLSALRGLSNLDALNLERTNNAFVSLRAADIVRMVDEFNVVSQRYGVFAPAAFEFALDGGSDDFIRLDARDAWRYVDSKTAFGRTYDVYETSLVGTPVRLIINEVIRGEIV